VLDGDAGSEDGAPVTPPLSEAELSDDGDGYVKVVDEDGAPVTPPVSEVELSGDAVGYAELVDEVVLVNWPLVTPLLDAAGTEFSVVLEEGAEETVETSDAEAQYEVVGVSLAELAP
jgi:hypothetical protein